MFDADVWADGSAEHAACETLRHARRSIDVAVVVAVLTAGLVLAAAAPSSAAAVYALLLCCAGWCCAVAWLVRAFSRQTQASAAGELAKAAPSMLLAGYVLCWLACDVMLLGTGALAGPFGRAVSGSVTVALAVMACFVAWHRPAASMFPLACACWAALALPGAAVTVSSAAAWLTAARLAAIVAVHAVLRVRAEARLTPAKVTELSHAASVRMIGEAAHDAAMHLVQTAWLVHCWAPAAMPVLALLVAALAEVRVHRAPSGQARL